MGFDQKPVKVQVDEKRLRSDRDVDPDQDLHHNLGFNPGLDPHHNPGLDPNLNPGFDSGLNPGPDPGFDPYFNPSLDFDHGFNPGLISDSNKLHVVLGQGSAEPGQGLRVAVGNDFLQNSELCSSSSSSSR